MCAFQFPTPYITTHEINRTITASVAAGLGVEPKPACAESWLPRPAVVYGILRGTATVIRKCESAGIPWWHLDLGYWGRGHFEGYYRLSRGGLQAPVLRRSQLRIPLPDLAPWQRGDGPIIVCPPTTLQCIFHPVEKLDVREWEDSVCRTIEALTDRPIIVRTKEERNVPLPADPYCIISYQSNICIEALIRGTPSITLGNGIMREYSVGLEALSDPELLRQVDRRELFSILSWGQFTLEEFRKGLPWQILSESG